MCCSSSTIRTVGIGTSSERRRVDGWRTSREWTVIQRCPIARDDATRAASIRDDEPRDRPDGIDPAAVGRGDPPRTPPSGCCRSPTRSTTPRRSCCRSSTSGSSPSSASPADTIALLAALGAFASGAVQLSYAKLTRIVSRRTLLAGRRDPVRRRVRGAGPRAEVRVVRRPQRRVADRRVAPASGRQRPARRAVPRGAARLRDQRPHLRRQRRHGRRGGRRRAADRARSAGAAVVVIFGIPAVVIAIAILLFVREIGRRTARRRSPTAASGTRSATVLADPRPPLDLPRLGPRRRRARPRRREPVRAALPDDRPRPAGVDVRT